MIRRLGLVVWALLCVAVLCLWARSHRLSDTVSFLSEADTNYSSITEPGVVRFAFTTNSSSRPPTYNPVSWDEPRRGWSHTTLNFWKTDDLFPSSPWISVRRGNTYTVNYPGYLEDGFQSDTDHGFPGVHWDSAEMRWPGYAGNTVVVRMAWVSVRFWVLIVPLAIPAAFMLASMVRRRRRLKSHRCLACGYDLRGGSGRCPECGTVTSRAGDDAAPAGHATS